MSMNFSQHLAVCTITHGIKLRQIKHFLKLHVAFKDIFYEDEFAKSLKIFDCSKLVT